MYVKEKEPRGKKQFSRSKRRRQDSVKMSSKNMVGGSVLGCMNLYEDGDKFRAFVNAVMNPWVPQGARNLFMVG